MFQVRIHGRGGQGVVTAAEMLSVAAFMEGRHAQAFPSFGSERTGAPIVAFCRIDDREIRSREPIDVPDALVIQDEGFRSPHRPEGVGQRVLGVLEHGKRNLVQSNKGSDVGQRILGIGIDAEKGHAVRRKLTGQFRQAWTIYLVQRTGRAQEDHDDQHDQQAEKKRGGGGALQAIAK